MTIDSYRYAFMLFLTFMEGQKVLADEVEISDLTHQNILKYLDWLQSQRSNSISTRNHRQAVINSFVKYLMYEFPDYLSEFQAILNIPVKKAPQKEIAYLKTDGIKLLFDQVDISSKSGIRDYAILMLLYTTGIRVSELIQIKVKDVSLGQPPTLLVHGKGQKSRFVPITKQAVNIITKYINSYNLTKDCHLQDWLFRNHLNEQFKRQGINYIIKKYADISRSKNSNLIPKNFSPHNMRHTLAMELVDSGVDLIYIRDLLGHVSVKTTEIYAKTNTTKKREAIEAASKEIVPREEAQWEQNSNIKDWLKNFNHR
ncbi:MAG: site-specific integrase [Oscillospiraceae bacterium]|nr:site-specific integrase [Oscillospiraceae bacterium]